MKNLLTLLIILPFAAFAQTTPLPAKWPLSGNYPKGFEIVVNQDAGNVILTITNTTQKKVISKNSFSNLLTIVHDTVYRDPKQSKEYKDLLASLAQEINNRDLWQMKYNSTLNELTDQQRQNAAMIKMLRDDKERHARDTTITMTFDKKTVRLILGLPVQK